MKNLKLLLLLLTIILSSCSKDETGIPIPEKIKTNPHFWGVKIPDNENSTKGVAQKDRLWYNGTTIKVKFLNDPHGLAETVKQYAAEWEQHANIKFDFVTTGKAQVRIAFDWNEENHFVSWSYIGTDCKYNSNQNEPTVNFALFGDCLQYNDHDKIRADILRAFGLVLGLELEHRHLDFIADWRSPSSKWVPNYWAFELGDVEWEDLKEYVFDPLDADNVLQTEEYDPLSVMNWPFPSNVLKNAVPENTVLSAKDIEFIKTIYPKDIDDNALIVMKTSKSEVVLHFSDCYYTHYRSNDIIIDWGDGVSDTVKPNDPCNKPYSHSYFNSNIHIIRIYGNKNDLAVFNCNNNDILKLDLTKCDALEILSCGANLLEELDVSKNILLNRLYCDENQLTNLDISNNPLMFEIIFTGNQIAEINLSNNHVLASLHCMNNLLTELDLSENPNLNYINCESNKLTFIDVSNNRELHQLSCGFNNITELDVSNNTELTALYFHYNPINEITVWNNKKLILLTCIGTPMLENRTAFENLAYSLPEFLPTSGQKGLIQVRNSTSALWIHDICNLKNWRVE